MSAGVLDRPMTDHSSVPSPSDIEAALLVLGSTAEEVAQSLHSRGIKGHPRVARSCPVANYLMGCFPSATRAVVYRDAFLFFEVDGFETVEGPGTDTPDGAWEFIQRFDAGAFDDLRSDR